MTRTRQVSALLVGLALAVGSYAGGFAAEPKPSGGGVTAGPAASAGSASGAAGTVAPTPAAARGYRAAEGGTPYPPGPMLPAAPGLGASAGSASGASPPPPAASTFSPRIYATPVPVSPPAPINPRVVELTQKYGEFDREISGLLEKARKTQDPAEKGKLRKQIQELVSRQFDLRQEARELELERLRKRLSEVEQTIGHHKRLKEKVVEHRVTELLDENAELKWEPLAGAAGAVGVVQETLLELEQVLSDGTRVKVPRTVVRVLPEGQTSIPPSSSHVPPADPTATPPSTPAPGGLPGGMMPPGSGIGHGGVGMTGPVTVWNATGDHFPDLWYPVVAPDGRQVAYHADEQLKIADMAAGKIVGVWPLDGWRGCLGGWSPDGSQLGYGAFGGEDKGLWVLSLVEEASSSSPPRQIASGSSTLPSWSADGSTLAFDFRDPQRGYEVCWPKGGGHTFTCVREVNQKSNFDVAEAKPGITKYWLRIIKRGNKYQYAYSYDGGAYVTVGEQTWGEGKPKKLGVLAKNGGNPDATEL